MPPVSAPPYAAESEPRPEPGPSLEHQLLRFGLVTLEQLGAAMREQTETGQPFAEVLVRDGILSAEDLARVQDRSPRQDFPPPPAPVVDRYAVVGRLVNGDELEIARVPDEPGAQRLARDAMRACAKPPSADWPVLNGRYVRPEAIVSIEVVELDD